MRNKAITTKIGKINLSEIALMEDSLEVYIPVTDLSEDIKAIVEENIPKAKEEYQREFLDKFNTNLKWSDAGTNMEFIQLHIVIKEKSFIYELCFDFEDKENTNISTRLAIDADLSEHINELKKWILEVFIEKFF